MSKESRIKALPVPVEGQAFSVYAFSFLSPLKLMIRMGGDTTRK